MTLLEHLARSDALRKELAQHDAVAAFGIEATRYAAVMALLFAIADLFPKALYAGAPWPRLRFILAFSVLMAVVQVWRFRRALPGTRRSFRRAI